MSKITLNHTGGPYGDACSSYDFELSKEMTFKEFVELVASNPSEWGYIQSRHFGPELASYRNGEVIYNIEDTSFMIEKTGSAHGGWSRMDYIITKKKGENNV